jgi:hypothetical protein
LPDSDAFQMRITPFQLDAYAGEFEEQVKAANAHRREVEALRLVNRNLAARVKSLEDELTSINAEHVELVKVSPLALAAPDQCRVDPPPRPADCRHGKGRRTACAS